MKKNIHLVLIFFFTASICVGCLQKRPQKEFRTFSEALDPTSDTLSDWSAVNKGLNASIVSIDTRYPKSVVPTLSRITSLDLTGWKGETLSGQLLLWAAEDITQVECEFDEFESTVGKLSANIATTRFVRYVLTDIFEPGCGYRKPEDFPVSLSADMLDTLASFNIQAKSVRPVWITVKIPQNAVAGNYKSKLKLFAQNQKTQEFEIELHIQNRTLPLPSQWAYHLDLWQHPSAVARTENLEPWSNQHFEVMKPLMQMLADAGQKVITATLNKDPWNVQTFDKYEDMISWTKNGDGTWSYEYAIFDKWIEFMMNLGIKKMINCYSIVPWNNELHYKDAKTGQMITVKADPGNKIFEEMWTPFLLDFKKHLKEKGWLEITNIAMDERSPREMQATLDLLKKVAPEFGISLADNHKSYNEYPYIKEISVAAGAKVDKKDIEMRRSMGLVTTYYVCCSDKFPNIFTFSSPAESVYAAWYAVAGDYDGFLRWAHNSWVENPLTDSRFRTWPAGDTYIVYPGARSSIRFERLKEGIQDAEKIRILRSELKGNPQKLELLEDEIKEFNTITPAKPCGEMLQKAKELINELSELK